VLIALLVGITIVYFLCNLVARPSQATGTPYPVASRISFGVLGANIPAIIRGLIAVAWYGIQTYLASVALVLLAIKLWPGLAPYSEVSAHGLFGLSLLGWIGFGIMWIAQAVVFWRGMESIRKFIDFCGPAVYVVMFLLAGYLVIQAGWSNIDFNLADGGITLTGWAVLPVLLSAIALVVSYFSGPMLNYGDFARYGRDFKAIKKGNFLGLPVNFLVFSLLVVITAAATRPVFGELIIDPVHTVARLDNVYAVVLGALTFMIATVGINIVANFVSPAYDISNLSPEHINFKLGGLITSIQRQMCIDPHRIFAAGISNGAGMVALLGCALSNELAAIAPVSGIYDGQPSCRISRPVSILEIHGTADQIAPYFGTLGRASASGLPPYVTGWVHRDACSRSAAEHAIATRTSLYRWGGCSDDTEVEHIRIQGGAHQWPGALPPDPGPPSTICGACTIWSFFSSLPVLARSYSGGSGLPG